MMHRKLCVSPFVCYVALVVFGVGTPRTAFAQTLVTTWHYDNSHSGANTSESILTPENVNVSSFGKLFVQPVDGVVIGQALYLPNVKLPKAGQHNVVYVATMNDSVYAFDADRAEGKNATPLWHTSLLPEGAQAVPIGYQGCGVVTGWTQVGVLSTPVIDPVAGTLYVVAKTYEHSSYVHRLHALDVTTGLEKTGSPVVIKASFEFSGKNYVFADKMQVNRPALLLENGTVYVAFGSNGCRGPLEEGWVMAFNSTTLEPMGVFDDEPGKSAAAIWMRGGGLSADSQGYVYGATADGSFAAGTNFGQSVFKLVQSGSTLQLSDWFTPYNEAYLDYNDMDMSEPVLVLPNQSGANPYLAAAVGKEGTIYLLNRDNMGHFCSGCKSDTQIVQELPAFAPETGALVYWNDAIYTTADGQPIKALALTNGVLAKIPFAQSKLGVASGHSPVISANGSTNGILWQLNGSDLTAYNATTLARLYMSSQAAGKRDVLPTLPHFANLVVANGKVYVGTNNSLFVLGLLD